MAPSMGSFVSTFGNGSITEGVGAQNPEVRAIIQQLKEAKREAATLQASALLPAEPSSYVSLLAAAAAYQHPS